MGRIPVISSVDAKTHSDPEVIKQILTKQVTALVQWESIMQGLIDGGLEKGYELGPGKVLAGIMKRVDKTKVIENIEVRALSLEPRAASACCNPSVCVMSGAVWRVCGVTWGVAAGQRAFLEEATIS